VHLNLKLVDLDDADVLPSLLQPALRCRGGWTNVHKLTVCTRMLKSWGKLQNVGAIKLTMFSALICHPNWCSQARLESAMYLHLLGPAMPELRQLELDVCGIDLQGGALFTGLQLCTALVSLSLADYSISEGAAKAAAAALARLPSLKDVRLGTAEYASSSSPAILVEHLTALTSLRFSDNSGEDPALLYTAAAHNPGLKSFWVGDEDCSAPSAASVEQLLLGCPSLSHITFNYLSVHHDVFCTLVEHGSSLTSLCAFSMKTEAAQGAPAKQPSWTRLHLQTEET
jgi:hypothetical protein